MLNVADWGTRGVDHLRNPKQINRILKKGSTILLLLIMVAGLSSCEKIIDFSLAGSESVLVIEANVSSGKPPFTVFLSKTLPYFGAKTDNTVSGAIVSLRTDKGRPKYFTETSAGNFKLEKTAVLPGYWYNLDVEYDGKLYSARSFLNEMVPIIDIGISYFDGYGLFDSGYKISTYLRDPANRENFYRIKYFINGIPVNDSGEISLYSDKLFDGKVVGLGQRTMVFQETDVLTVELQSIDKATYDYFSTLETISGSVMDQTASPANPISNFNNGALGYFAAFSADRRTFVIKDFLKK